MFIDRCVIEVRSGKGGDGMIAFLREKYVAKGGPAGGNGGRGASIYLRANSHINTLFNFRHSKAIIGKDGEKGGIKNQFGKYAEDVIVDVPLGTVIFEEKEHKFLGDLNEDGKMILVAKGGRGGRGNSAFKSSTYRVPKIAENGEPGESKRLILELKLLADVGLVGLPSVGKSTFLSIVSSAKPEIADYPFTTIVPNLGVVSIANKSFVMADLPGLIEGAHQGKGLGLQFLRHIERCRVIVHIVDMSDNGRDAVSDYRIINKELEAYGFGLNKRPMIVVASKMDDEGAEAKLKDFIKRTKVKPLPISALTDEGVNDVLFKCLDLLEKTPTFPLYQEENEEQLDFKTYSIENEDKEFEIIKEKPHQFRIVGDKIIKFYKMTNTTTDDGIMILMSKLRKLRIDDELEKMGANDGDIVYLEDFEFEFFR